MLDMVREMMQYRVRDISDPSEIVVKAKELIDVMAGLKYEDNRAYGAFLNTYRSSLVKKLDQWEGGGDSLLLHDELSEVNDPVYFHEFAEHAGKHGLQYLSEVDLYQISPARYPKETVTALGQMAKDSIDFEQYIDFLQHRTFRKSLICHREAPVTRRLRPESLDSLYLSSYAESVAKSPDVKGATIEQFKGKDGAIFSTDQPLSKAALLYLSKNAPNVISFEELVTATTTQIGIAGEKKLSREVRALAANMLQAYSYSESLVQLHVYRPSFVTQISERPQVSPVARWQAARSSMVTSMRYERVTLERISRQIFIQLDGKHDREDILDHLLKLFEDGTIVFTSEEEEEKGTGSLPELITKEIDHNLKFYAWTSLLIA